MTPSVHHPVLLDLAALFGRLGATSFGGPAAHIAMMEEEVVRRRSWLTPEEFLDLVGACQLIPGPNSTELAIHIGYRRAGWAGLLVAGTCFILPAALLTTVLAWAYVRMGSLPAAAGLLYGVKPVVLAVVVTALITFVGTALKHRTQQVLAVLCLGTCLAGIPELALLAVAGGASAVAITLKTRFRRGTPLLSLPLGWLWSVPTGWLPVIATVGLAASPPTLGGLFLVFARIGSVLFGSGYVLLAFLQAECVDRSGWLTQSQLLDAVAVGQFTPGPVFTTATFIGYLIAGLPGAVVATLGIFLPAFVFVALSGPLVPRIRRSPVAGAFLDGVITASLVLMALVTVRLASDAVVDGWTLTLALASALLLKRFQVNSGWLILAGAVAGWMMA